MNLQKDKTKIAAKDSKGTNSINIAEYFSGIPAGKTLIDISKLNELQADTKRISAITIDTIFDNYIKKLLLSHFSQRDKAVEELFDTNIRGPLVSLTHKAKLLYALGLIDKIARKDLEYIHRIRNKFAHSVDENIRAIDLSEVIDLVVALSARFTLMHNVKIELNPTLEQVSITTSPFFIENLLWRCLNFAVDSIGQGETIGIMLEETEKGAEIKFTGIQDIGESQPDSFPGDAEKALLKTLKAEVKTDLMCQELRLSFPKDITK